MKPKVIKKYTAVKVEQTQINNESIANFSFGFKSGPYYDEKIPKTEHDSEDDAIQYAYEEDRSATWLIVPIINFEYDYNS